MTVIALPPLAGLPESAVNHFTRRCGIDFHAGSRVVWTTKFAVYLATATIAPYFVLIAVIAIATILNHAALGDALLMVVCVFFCGWLLALPCVLAVLASALFGRYFLRALTILFPFFLLIGWDTLGSWWDWQDEESRFHDVSFGNQVFNWVFCAGQTVWASSIKYLLYSIAIRLLVMQTAKFLVRWKAAMVSYMMPKITNN